MPAESSIFSAFDRLAMSRALELAARGLESTDPNPRVGCVIAKEERILAEGWHERAGDAHAEIVALRLAGNSAARATAYVTLEPCSHYGRTPPCVSALIEAGIARVVYAVQDPNPRVSGQGAAALSRAGISVESGLMSAEADELNVGFMSRMRRGTPWVRLKLAMSLDGRTALANGASQWITGEVARDDVQRWRARSSAVLTGIGTILADNPRLNVRLDGEKRRQPMRVVLDSEMRIPPSSKLFDAEGDVLIFTSDRSTSSDLNARGAALSQVRARVVVFPVPEEHDQLSLAAVMRKLGTLEVNEVLVEAGARLAGALLAGSWVDELLLYVAPKLLGPQARALVDLPELQSLQKARRFALLETQRLGDDLRLRLRPQ